MCSSLKQEVALLQKVVFLRGVRKGSIRSFGRLFMRECQLSHGTRARFHMHCREGGKLTWQDRIAAVKICPLLEEELFKGPWRFRGEFEGGCQEA